MKTNALKIAAIMLMLAGSCSSCEEKSESGGDVTYKPCPCEEDKPLSALNFPRGEAYLFKNSIPKQMDYQIRTELSDASYAVCWIVFDSETNNACLTVGGGAIRNICEICNFPDFVKEWDIPQNGCKVNFEGITYESCTPNGGIATISYFDYVLTSLKKK